MKIEQLSVPRQSRPATAGQKGVSPAGAAPDRGIAGAEHTAARSIPGEERRRSQRVLLRVRAQIHVALEGKAATFNVLTLNVNPHGALVVMEKCLVPGTRLVLENHATRERVACKVPRQPRESTEGFQVPLEFDSPAPRFWGIAFPPADWRADD